MIPAHTILATPRLFLRPPIADDALPMAALAGDWDVASMTGQLPYPYNLASAAAYIAELPLHDPLRQAFAITHNGQLIGVTGFTANNTEQASFGYWIGKPFWNHGFATEAAGAIITYCFKDRGFQKLTCAHFEGNAASARVIEKLGFHHIGPARGWCEATQTEKNTLTYALEANVSRPRHPPEQ